MAEYIERDFALDVVKRTSGDYAAAWAEIAHAQAADVAPVVHSYWGEYESFPLAPSMNGYPCMKCGMHFRASSVPVLNYCPNCGAKMDL